MIRIEVYCEGTTPLLLSSVNEEKKEQIRSGVSKPRNRNRPVREEAAERLYIEGGLIGFPFLNVFSCLANAGTEVQYKGVKKVSTSTSTRMTGFLRIEETFIPLVYKSVKGWTAEKEWVPDVRLGKDSKTGKIGVIIVRPRFDRWGFVVTIVLNESIASEETARKLFDVAGSIFGLGDFRPGKSKGPFGTFEVKGWTKLGEVSVTKTRPNKGA